MTMRIKSIAFVILVQAATSWGQHSAGGIEGSVVDPSGAHTPGASITFGNTQTGLVRAVTSNHEGRYRVLGLPSGTYELVAELKGLQSRRHVIQVPMGPPVKVDIELTSARFSDSIEVTARGLFPEATRPVFYDVLPVTADATNVTPFVPSAVLGDPQFDPTRLERGNISSCGNEWTTPNSGWGTPGQQYLSIGGSSIAENVYQLDGLDITNFSTGLGSSSVPMEFVEAIQIGSGGVGVAATQTTGAVINMVTRRGTNQFRGDLFTYWMPERLQEHKPDTHSSRNQDETRSNLELGASLGGSLVRDRLFFFLFARYMGNRYSELSNRWGVRYEISDPYLGARLDWNISTHHRIEGTWFSDSVEIAKSRFAYDPATDTEDDHLPGNDLRGGMTFSLRYSGVLRNNLLFTAQVGRTEYDRSSWSEGDDCPVALEASKYGYDLWEYIPTGCWVNEVIGSWFDARNAFRFDVDWLFRRHGVRMGANFERTTPDSDQRSSGGVKYIIGPNEGMYRDLPDDLRIAQTEHWSSRGDFESLLFGAYLQDRWTPASNLSVELGLRWQREEGRNGLGDPLIAAEDAIAPRLAVAWNPDGNGRSLLYGSLGLYHMPIPASLNVHFGAAECRDTHVHVLDGGVLPDGSPEGLGEQLFSTVFATGAVRDAREILAYHIEPSSQTEAVLGFRIIVGENWSIWECGRWRDASVRQSRTSPSMRAFPENTEYTWRIPRSGDGNPGRDFEGYCDLDRDGVLDPVFIPAEAMGYPLPEREYYAAEATLSRRFANRWMMQGSYTWSHLYGNYEGLVSSDHSADISSWNGLTRSFDWPGMMDHASGDLPNDRRHNVKLLGTYTSALGLNIGGVFFFLIRSTP